MSTYNPDFFKANKPSERLIHHISDILSDLDPKLKDSFLADMKKELAGTGTPEHFDLSHIDLSQKDLFQKGS